MNVKRGKAEELIGEVRVRWQTKSNRDIGCKDGIFTVYLPCATVTRIERVDANDGRVWFLRDVIKQAKKQVQDG